MCGSVFSCVRFSSEGLVVVCESLSVCGFYIYHFLNGVVW